MNTDTIYYGYCKNSKDLINTQLRLFKMGFRWLLVEGNKVITNNISNKSYIYSYKNSKTIYVLYDYQEIDFVYMFYNNNLGVKDTKYKFVNISNKTLKLG
jgi:hypothetical protein